MKNLTATYRPELQNNGERRPEIRFPKTPIPRLIQLCLAVVLSLVWMSVPAFGSICSMTDEELTELILEVHLYSFPLYETYRTRHADVYDRDNPLRADLNSFSHEQRLNDHTTRWVVTPNNDTLYSRAWLDLSKEPVILSVPDTAGRYYVIAFMDVYTNNFAYVGRRTTGTKAGEYLITGPDWQGEAPEGLPIINAPNNTVFLLGRTLVDGEADLPAVHAIQDQYRLTSLAVWNGTGTAKVRTDLTNPPPPPDPEDSWNFFTLVNRNMTENPPPGDEADLMSRFSVIGVGPGLTFDPQLFTESQQAVIRAALKEGAAAVGRLEDIVVRQGWLYPPLNIGNFGDDYLVRGRVARLGLFALEPAEAYYYLSLVDERMRPLRGQSRYRLHFSKDGLPPVNAFWSLSMYELLPSQEQYFTKNPLGRYSIGDRTRNLSYNEDGSLDIYIQHMVPCEDLHSNWLPTPEGLFRMVLRVYEPGEAILADEYRVPPIQLLE